MTRRPVVGKCCRLPVRAGAAFRKLRRKAVGRAAASGGQDLVDRAEPFPARLVRSVPLITDVAVCAALHRPSGTAADAGAGSHRHHGSEFVVCDLLHRPDLPARWHF